MTNKWSKQERMVVLVGILLVVGIVFFISLSFLLSTVSHWGGQRTTEQTRRAWETYTPRPRPTLTPPTPTPWVNNTPTPDIAIATIEAMLFGCGGLSEYEQKKIYWSMVVAQDEARRQADAQGRRYPDYVLAETAVMSYFSISARTLECIKDKGGQNNWPMPPSP